VKRIYLGLVLWLLLVLPIAAQTPTKIYLPIVLSNGCQSDPIMSDWKIIIPEATSNMALNPSAETTGNYAAGGGATITLSTTYQHYGLYSYRVVTNGDNKGLQLTLAALTNAIHYVTMRVRGTLPASWDWSLDNATYTSPVLLEQIDSNWALYGLQFPAAQANGATTLYIYQNGAGSGDFYIDGVQVEANSTWTTYCDGTQQGCAWNGAPDASTSTRSSQSRAGGRVYDLQTDYYLNISGMSGAGTPPQTVGIDKYAVLPGGQLNNIKIDSRVFTLTGVISATDTADFHAKRQTLLNALSPDTYPEDDGGVQPIRLRYNGAVVHKEIAVHYDDGLEGALSASDPCAWEKVAIRFVAPDSYFTDIGESAALLDTNDSATFEIIAGRLKSTGQWSTLGPPNAAGTYIDVLAIAEDATYVYIGGEFQNWDNIANADYIVRYNKQTGVYSALGTGTNNVVVALAVGANGTLYAGGAFTTAGGGAAAYIASWNGVAWSALGTGMNTTVRALAIGADGTLYAGGAFTTAGGGGANYIAKWNGVVWAALGTGTNALVSALIIGLDGSLYASGNFTTAGGITVNYIAKWNGVAWSALGAGMDNIVTALAIGIDGTLYAAGSFTTAGGSSASHVARWNGTVWAALGTGLDGGYVLALSVGSDGILYIGGYFTSAGGITLSDRVARWNGYAWAHLDVDLPGNPTIMAILASKYTDPLIKQQYDLYLGFDATGTGYFAGKATPTNAGNAPAYPKVIYNRSAGTTAIIETLRNERTGKELLYNYSLLSGETLTTDLAPTQKSIVSSFFGSRQDAILPNSDFGTWALLPGANIVTSFVATTGAPTLTGYLLWKNQFKSQD
jgi:hypothetical protein